MHVNLHLQVVNLFSHYYVSKSMSQPIMHFLRHQQGMPQGLPLIRVVHLFFDFSQQSNISTAKEVIAPQENSINHDF
jgi:hypothetical protein